MFGSWTGAAAVVVVLPAQLGDGQYQREEELNHPIGEGNVGVGEDAFGEVWTGFGGRWTTEEENCAPDREQRVKYHEGGSGEPDDQPGRVPQQFERQRRADEGANEGGSGRGVSIALLLVAGHALQGLLHEADGVVGGVVGAALVGHDVELVGREGGSRREENGIGCFLLFLTYPQSNGCDYPGLNQDRRI